MGQFYLCTEIGCNRKYITKNKLVKHLLDAHEIVKSEDELGEAVEITKENKKTVETKKNKLRQDELQQEKIKEINKKKQLELEAKIEAEKELKQKYLDQYKELEENKLMLERKQLELEEKRVAIVSLVHDRIEKNSSECSICADSMGNTACVPCGHKNFCYECIDNYWKTYKQGCPVCRAEIKSLVKIFA